MKRLSTYLLGLGGFVILYLGLSLGAAELSAYLQKHYTASIYLDFFLAGAVVVLSLLFGLLTARLNSKKLLLLTLLLFLLLGLAPYLFLFLNSGVFLSGLFQQLHLLALAYAALLVPRLVMRRELQPNSESGRTP